MNKGGFFFGDSKGASGGTASPLMEDDEVRGYVDQETDTASSTDSTSTDSTSPMSCSPSPTPSPSPLLSQESNMLPTSKIAFMGFSQGAMLALDTALFSVQTPVAGVVLVSGFLMTVEDWAQRLARNQRGILRGPSNLYFRRHSESFARTKLMRRILHTLQSNQFCFLSCTNIGRSSVLLTLSRAPEEYT